MTDVSAGALAAGTGALPGLGKPPGAPVGTSEFETELNAFADAVPGELPGEQGGGEIPPAFAALFTPGEAAFGPAANGGLPEAAGPAGSAPGPAPENDGADGVPVPSGASAPLAGPFVPPAATPVNAPASSAPDLPDTAGQPQADTAPVSLRPDLPPEVPFNPPEMRPAGAAPQTLTPEQPVQPGVSVPAMGSSNEPAAPSQAAASAPGVPQGKSPAPATQAASVIEPAAIAPQAGQVANIARLGEPALKSSETAPPAPQQRPVQGVVPGPAAAQPPVNGRRWQTELPSELRAPAPALPKAAQPPALDQGPLTAPATPNRSPANTTAVSLDGGTSPTLAAASVTQTAQPRSGDVVGQPVVDGFEWPVDTEIAKAPQRNSAEPDAPAVGQFLRQSPQTAGTAPVTTQTAPDPSPEMETDGFEPVSLKAEATPKDNKPSVQGPVSETQTAGQRFQPGAPAGAQPAANAGDARPQAVPVAAAVVAAQLPLDDPEAVTKPIDLTTTGDFVATVRGGETQGAVRTESLQTPNQAQSGQVATQVAAEIARNLKNGQTRFQMRFDPPELGRVDVNMRVGADGGVHAHLIVERPETLDMFLRDQRGLERALEAAGLNADSENLQFSLKQEGGRDFASGDGQGEQAAQAGEDANGSQSDDLDAETEAVIRLALAESRGGLDVMI
ncbi:MAG: flagellar hook-length control protein FliK [Pseudomonadota bacterium]